MLVRHVRRKSEKANRAAEKYAGPRDLAKDAEHGELLAKAASLRELLYALGASPTWKIASRIKGALDEHATEKLKRKIRRDGDNADDAAAFLKINGWLDPELNGGHIAVFLVPVEGARARVLLTGRDRANEVLARVVPLHQLVEVFESIPREVGRKLLISDLGFTSFKSWDAALEAK